MEHYSIRQNRVARLVQKEMSELLRKEGRSMLGGRMVSVTVVRVTKDLSLARCYLSVFPSEGAEEVLTAISKSTGFFRKSLGQLVRHQLRVVPELEFYIDDSLDYIDNIDSLLS